MMTADLLDDSDNETKESGSRLKVQIKDAESSRREWLRIKVLTPECDGDGRLRVLLTNDDNDPSSNSGVMFYSTSFTEEDYRRFRDEQGLLVDMANFPPMIQRLVEMAAADETGQRFFTVLDLCESEVHLSFVEINAFRKLTHLKLRMAKGSDSQIKKHLSLKLSELKVTHGKVLTALRKSQNDLGEKTTLLGQVQSELERFKRAQADREAEVTEKLAIEMGKEREKCSRELGIMKDQFLNERNRSQEDHAAVVRRLQNQIASLEYENKDLTERRHRNEANLVTLSEEVKRQQQESARLRQEVEKKTVETDRFGEGAREMDHALQRVRSQVTVLEAEVQRLGSELQSKSETIKSVSEEKTRLIRIVEEKTVLVTKRETAVKTVTQELLKANDSIKKVQEECRRLNHKVRLSQKILEEQEKIIAKKDQELEEIRTQLKDQSEMNRNAEQVQQNLRKQIELQKDELDKAHKAAKTSDNVIQWLNKQLTAAKIRDPGLRVGPPPTSLASLNTTPATPMISAKNMVSSTPKNPVIIEENSDDENHSDNTVGKSLDPKYLRPSKGIKQMQPKPSSKKSILQSSKVESVYFS